MLSHLVTTSDILNSDEFKSLPPKLEVEDRAIRAWRKGEIDDNQFIIKLTPTLKRLASWSCDRYGVNSLKDDAFQELCIALVTKAGKDWNPSQPISTYMAGWAWRIASSMANESKKEASFDVLFEENELDAVIEEQSIEQNEDLIIESIDDEVSRKAFLKKISLKDLDAEVKHLSKKDEDKKPKNIRKTSKVKDLVRDERLYDLRYKAGLTRAEMAEAMGIPLSKYAAYETGKTRKVPDHVYQNAEMVVENASARAEYSKLLCNRSMSEIVELWCAMAGTSRPDDIAKILKISVRTLRRWLYNNYKPRHNIVISHHLQIVRHGNKREF